MDRKKLHKDNTGMTLLEVIVAVSIFSITAIVLLQSFVTSSRINKKSNTYLEATTVAQNIMEEIKAKKFEQVALAFNYPLDMNGNSRIEFLNTQKDKIKNGTLGIREVLPGQDANAQTVYNDVMKYREGIDESKVTASVISTDGGKTYKFNPRKSGENASKYYFELSNVTNNYETFDALIQFDGSSSSGYKNGNNNSAEKEKNDYLSPNIANLDTKSNILFIVPKDKYLKEISAENGLLDKQYNVAHHEWEEDLKKYCGSPGSEGYDAKLNEFQNSPNYKEPQKLNAEDVFNSAKKTLRVILDYTEDTGEVKITFKYTINAHDYVSKDNSKYGRMDLCACGGNPDKENSDPMKEDAYFCTINVEKEYNQDVDNELKNIYIFYYPNYYSTNATKPLDEIIFENTDNYPVNLYISKQQDEKETDKTALAEKENKYHVSVIVKESPSKIGNSNWNTNTSLYKSKTKLRTNLDKNISSKFDTLDRPNIIQMKLEYIAVNASGANERSPITGKGAKKILDYNGLDDKENKDRIYTVKVGVYKAGAAAKNFPDDELIVTLDGAEEN
ncbi:type II secretion system protein [Blautia wexlerae]|uniref:Type II secretion system protein n=1 Tax=Blautia wexlerae TaxID=418240 RepID=A0ABX2GQB0_9FIRM|nr:type II secretion system protein [Blautia wexlerae]NSF73855.1 type II secretion system protein [Blautia wexlerae]